MKKGRDWKRKEVYLPPLTITVIKEESEKINTSLKSLMEQILIQWANKKD